MSSNITSSEGIVYYDSKNPAKCITDFESSNSWIMLLFLLIPLTFVVVGVGLLKVHFKHLKKLKNLATFGVLVKGVPYQVTNSNVLINNRTVMCFRVVFTFPNGITKTLTSDPAYNNILQDPDGRCDLLYDPNDYNNYCVELEITTTGNGKPNIVYYEQTQQFYNNSYSPENKF